MKLWAILLLSVNFITVAFASSDIQSAQAFAKDKLSTVIDQARQKDPHSIPGFVSDHPAETQYQHEDLKQAAKVKAKIDKTAIFIDHSAQTRAHIIIDKDSALVSHANEAVNRGQDSERQTGSICADGDCTDTSYVPSPDFNQAVSALSAAASASKDKQKFKHCTGPRWHRVCHIDYHIFTGSRASCRISWVGYDNCCADSGWGKDIGLAGCHANEKILGQKKEAGMCHYVGRYCSKWIHFPFHKVCREHSKSYCCFNSKLARIVQEGGRAQLRQGWGGGNSPDCHGFTAKQVQQIDFSRLNLQAFEEDIQREMHTPDMPATQAHIRDEAQAAIDHGEPQR